MRFSFQSLRLLRCGALSAAFLLGGVGTGETLRLVDAEGSPVADARVELVASPEVADLLEYLLPPLVDATSGPDGSVPAEIPRLENLLLLVDHPELAPLALDLGAVPEAVEIIRLESGWTWEHRVELASGRLQEGRICASWDEDLEAWGVERTWRRCAEIGPSGEFVLRGLPPGPVRLAVRSARHLPERRTLRPGQEVVLRLEEGLPIAGRVLGPGDAPVREARINVDEGGSATSLADGSFRVAAARLPARLEVSAPGFRQVEAWVNEEEGARATVIRLRRSESLSGTLVDSRGVPIPEATVWVERWAVAGRRTRSYRVQTDDGDFEIELRGPGTYRPRIRAAGYREERLPEIVLGEGQQHRLGTLELSRGGAVRGLFVDVETRRSVPGVDVRLIPAGLELLDALRHREVGQAVSDRAGKFAIRGLRPGRYELRARHARLATEILALDVEGARTTELGEVGLEAGRQLSGVVLGRSGEPRADLSVRFYGPDRGTLLAIAERTTDRQGRFTGPILSGGTYRAEVHGRRLLLSQEFEVAPGGGGVRELTLSLSGVRIDGRVTRRGQPVSGGLVTAVSALDPGLRMGKVQISARGLSSGHGLPRTSESALVGSDGTFYFSEAPAGILWLTYSGTDGRRIERQVEVPDEPEAPLVLEIGGVTLRGEVTDERDGSGIPAEVRVAGPGGRTVGSALSGPAGRFAVGDLAPGRYGIEVSAAGYRTLSLREVRLREETPPLSVGLERGDNGTVRVRLARFDGSPASGGLVSLLSETGAVLRSLPVDGFGERSFEEIPAGEYYLAWSDPVAGVGASPVIEVEPGETTTFEKDLPPGGSLVLWCRAESCGHSVIADLAIYSVEGLDLGPFLSGISPAARFSETGGITLGRLSPGEYLLRLWTREELPPKAFEIGAQETVIVSVP